MSNDLGDAVYRRAARSLRFQREALADQLSRFQDNPLRNSPCYFDGKELSVRSKKAQARRWILDETIRQAGRITGSAADHMVALETCLVGTPEAQFCTMTLWPWGTGRGDPRLLLAGTCEHAGDETAEGGCSAVG